MRASWNFAEYNIPGHEAEPLLTDNETYINAIQRASVSLYHLGFRDQRLPSAAGSNVSEPALKAVLPKDDQVEFLENIDRGLKFLANSHLKSNSRRKHYDKQGISGLHERSPLQRQVDELFPKKAGEPNPFRYGRTPHFATPSQRLKELQKKELEDEENRRRHRKHMQMLCKHLDIIRDGVKCNYDPLTGKLVPLPDYTKSVAKLKKMATARTLGEVRPKSAAVFTGQLLEKTSRHVEALRKAIQEERAPRRWPRPVATYLDWPRELLQMHAEFGHLKEGEVLLTIEHCANCFEHEHLTHHKEEKYAEMCEVIIVNVKEICKHYPVTFYAVLKPLQLDRSSGASADLSRIGALEVTLACRPPGSRVPIVQLLYSKLYTGMWPKVLHIQKACVHVLEGGAGWSPLPPPCPPLPPHFRAIFTSEREGVREHLRHMAKRRKPQSSSASYAGKKAAGPGEEKAAAPLGPSLLDQAHLYVQPVRAAQGPSGSEDEDEEQDADEERSGDGRQAWAREPPGHASDREDHKGEEEEEDVADASYRREQRVIVEEEEEGLQNDDYQGDFEAPSPLASPAGRGGKGAGMQRGASLPSLEASPRSTKSTAPLNKGGSANGLGLGSAKGAAAKPNISPKAVPTTPPSKGEQSLRAIQSLPSVLPSHRPAGEAQGGEAEHGERVGGSEKFDVEKSREARKTITILQKLLQRDDSVLQQNFLNLDDPRLTPLKNEEDFWKEVDASVLSPEEKKYLRRSMDFAAFGNGDFGSSSLDNS